MKYSPYFFQETDSDISCKLYQMETVCIKCQILFSGSDISSQLSLMETVCMKFQKLFSGKNKKNIINLLSAELAKFVIKVNILVQIQQMTH